MRKRKKVYSYQINLIPESEGGYTVLVPMLPECVSYGATIEEATANAETPLSSILKTSQPTRNPFPKEMSDSGFHDARLG